MGTHRRGVFLQGAQYARSKVAPGTRCASKRAQRAFGPRAETNARSLSICRCSRWVTLSWREAGPRSARDRSLSECAVGRRCINHRENAAAATATISNQPRHYQPRERERHERAGPQRPGDELQDRRPLLNGAWDGVARLHVDPRDLNAGAMANTGII